MIHQVYRLFAPGKFRVDFADEEPEENEIIVRPGLLSICAADMRYFSGHRDPKALRQKLPMALIHEATGTVVYDPKGQYPIGTKVVMVPNTPVEDDGVTKENYLRSSKFKSSGYDGFMQSLVFIRRDRVVPYGKLDDHAAVLSEMLSVSFNALEAFDKTAHKRRETIGVWGCGSVGFCMALVLRYRYPDARLCVIGKSMNHLQYVTFADEVLLTDDLPDDFTVDHAFECVGGANSGEAINQIIDHINPQGTICLMGVSENNVSVNTRMVLEKGLTFVGNSRSSREDFIAAVDFLTSNRRAGKYLKTIISEVIEVNEVRDMTAAFNHASANTFKTIMEWKV